MWLLISLVDLFWPTACYFVDCMLLWLKGFNQEGTQLAGRLAVVGAEIADVDVQGCTGDFWPSVEREMGFGKDDCAGDPGRLQVGGGKLMEKTADDGESVLAAGCEAECFQFRCMEQELFRATAGI